GVRCSPGYNHLCNNAEPRNVELMQPMTERHAWSRRRLKFMQCRQDELQHPARRRVR
ncbi:hypothetical protein COCCADRAFT_87120, partial [Bipolaris zeicola 26-R-13]